jgi:hypothetical protein
MFIIGQLVFTSGQRIKYKPDSSCSQPMSTICSINFMTIPTHQARNKLQPMPNLLTISHYCRLFVNNT